MDRDKYHEKAALVYSQILNNTTQKFDEELIAQAMREAAADAFEKAANSIRPALMIAHADRINFRICANNWLDKAAALRAHNTDER